MCLIREQLLRPRSTSVLPTEQTHRLSPRLRRDQRERNAERGENAFEYTSRTAEAECRGHALPRHRVDFLDYGEAVLGVRAKSMRKGHGINLVDGPRPSFNFGSWHINHDD